ncbi:MAG: hypothetical protein PUF97_05555 [Bifidobacteriaceae bacterium]|nr:hypothetical protein [Bifidobacteriaceae bacterium]
MEGFATESNSADTITVFATASPDDTAMGWAWSDGTATEYGGAPCGTRCIGALSGVLMALLHATNRPKSFFINDLDAVRLLGKIGDLDASSPYFPLLKAIADETHDETIHRAYISEATSRPSVKARFFANQQLQIFTDDPTGVPSYVPSATVRVLTSSGLVEKARAAYQERQAHIKDPETAESEWHKAKHAQADAETIALEDAHDAGGSERQAPHVVPDGTTPFDDLTAAPTSALAAERLDATAQLDATAESDATPSNAAPSNAAPSDAATETSDAAFASLDAESARHLAKARDSFRQAAKNCLAVADAYEEALDESKGALPSIDGYSITPMSAKYLKKARKHMKSAAESYDKAADRIDAYLASAAVSPAKAIATLAMRASKSTDHILGAADKYSDAAQTPPSARIEQAERRMDDAAQDEATAAQHMDAAIDAILR